jgi:hypothetical protein
MAIGPAGLSVGIRHHLALGHRTGTKRPIEEIYPERGFRVFEYDAQQQWEFPAEPLTVGDWAGISGAAFSTGLGYRTSVGLSALAGLSNVRLGYWWDSDVRTSNRNRKTRDTALNALLRRASVLFPSQIYFLHELLAVFPGTSRTHWYLSDGGHFENLGGYELLRRRLPLIVLVDAEADPEYTFGGLANLVRKARIDFSANITFLSKDEIPKVVPQYLHGIVGPLDALKPLGKERRSRKRAAVARVTYEDEPNICRWLLYVKPVLIGDEPADILEYASGHPPFPQQTTVDQFFDEAQWESYRKLGEHIGEKIFGPIAASGRGLTHAAVHD